jgi:hydroxyacylglutathione hydrolase
MLIQKVVTGSLEENCWILRSEKEAVIIDPGDAADKILAELGGSKVSWILLTHSHIDHLGALSELAKKTGGEIAVHSSEADIVESGEPNPPNYPVIFEPVELAKKLADGDELKFGEERSLSPSSRNEERGIEVIHTPGHTQGSCCFLVGRELFSGDTLFRQTYGRTDLPGGDSEAMRESLNKLQKLPENTIVHPGHGEDWTIRDAKKFHFPI